jgi:hypothetical protein
MKKSRNTSIEVKGTAISVVSQDEADYICLTDIARYKNPENTDDIIRNWLRNRNTVEFLGIWEQLNNPDFKPVEFDGFRMQAGLNSFTLSPKQWTEKTGAIGIISKSGRYGGGTSLAWDLNQIAIRQMQTLTSRLDAARLPTGKEDKS